MYRTATITPCGQFRYTLTRVWDPRLGLMLFIMLNPSTADGLIDDATIRKCIGFATRMGFGGFIVVNLFAHRATDPADMKRAGYPVGPENDDAIRCAIHRADTVVCAWGAEARGMRRALDVLDMVREAGVAPKALAFTDDGIPRHPLMLSYEVNGQARPLLDIKDYLE